MNFRVKSSIWKIELKNPKSNLLLRSDRRRSKAVADNNTKTIYIADNIPPFMQWKVICHEIVHVFCFEYNVVMPIELEEKLADFISSVGDDIVYLTNHIFIALKNKGL